MKQDRQGVRTPSDVEQKYGLGQFMYEQRQAISSIESNLSNLGDSFALYKESTNAHLTELDDEYEALNKSHAELQKKTTNKFVQTEKSIKTNASAVKALSLEVDKNSGALKDNETSLANLRSDLDSSLWFARLKLTAEQTIATANTYQAVPLVTQKSYGSFFTVSSDGKKVTFTKKMIVTVSSQVYFNTGYSDGAYLRTAVKLSGADLARGNTVSGAASPYTTVPTASATVQVEAGDYLELQAYSSKAGGVLYASAMYCFLNIDVKGVI